jgi:hypothetical protein
MSEQDRAGELFRNSGTSAQGVRERLLDALSDSSALVRHVAAIRLADGWPTDLPEKAIRELLDTLGSLEYHEPVAIQDDYRAATDTGEEDTCPDLGNDIVRAFTYLQCGQANFVIHRLLEFWSFDVQQYDFGHALIALSFPKSDRKVDGENLSGIQRGVLKAVIRQEDIWSGDGYWKKTLRTHGLPENQTGVRKLLGYEW